MRKHKTVCVRVGDLHADIDVKIAPLIREMWKAGIRTEQSCQSFSFGRVQQRIWIQFECCLGLARFLDILCGSRETRTGQELHSRIQYHWVTEQRDPKLYRKCWWYRIHVLDLALQDTVGPNGAYVFYGPSNFMPTVDVFFPPTDL